MAIQGFMNTTAFDTPSGRRPQHFRELLLRLQPNGGGATNAPLTALTTLMRTEATDDPVFHWFTKQMQERRLKLAATLAATSSGTPVAGTVQNLTVDATFASAFGVKEGDLLLVEQTNEILYVNATPTAATTVSVIRGFEATAGANVAAVTYNGAGINPYLKVIGSAYEEGSAAPDPVAFEPIEVFNQTQIFRGTYALTNTARATRTRLGSEEVEAKREAMEIFGLDMEMGLIFGKKTTTWRNGQPLRTTNGIMSYIPNDRRYAPTNGALTMDQLEAWMTEIFRYGSEEKLVFGGNVALSAISRMVRKNGNGQFNISDRVSEYGIGGIRRLYGPTGTLVLKAHPLFSQMSGGVNGGTAFTSMANALLIVDANNLRYRPLRGRDVKFENNLQLPGVDGLHAGWIGEAGLELHHPYTHAFIGGIVTGEADA